MQCAISGETPEEPVVSVKSGHVFEKRLILKHLNASNGRCPVTDEPLSLDDLITLQVNKVVKPRPTTATSIPSMLALFQNEWDALMLETYSLKQQLESVRQELSDALYQHDAACRVIARLMKEKDEARSALEHFKATYPGGTTVQSSEVPSGGDSMEVERTDAGITNEIKDRIKAKAQELSKERKSRQISEDLATVENLAQFKMLSTNNTHKPKEPGVTCIAIHPQKPQMVLTGGVDKQVNLFNREVGKVASTFAEHTNEITDVLFHPSEDVFFSASKDNTARVWRGSQSQVIEVHSGEVTGLTLHATGDYWATASLDHHWAFHDLHSSSTLANIDTGAGVHSLHFHPDGLLLGTGQASGEVKLWDIKSLKNVATFTGQGGAIASLQFSENGYYLVSAANNAVQLWDLRKQKNLHSVEIPTGSVSSVSFDYSGSYLAVAGDDVRVYLAKTMNHLATYAKHTKAVTDVAWGPNASFLGSTSMDRSMKFWGIKEK